MGAAINSAPLNKASFTILIWDLKFIMKDIVLRMLYKIKTHYTFVQKQISYTLFPTDFAEIIAVLFSLKRPIFNRIFVDPKGNNAMFVAVQ